MQASLYSLKALLAYFKTKFVVNGLFYKHGALTTVSVGSATTLSFINFHDNYFGLSLMLILIYCLFVFFDSITGIFASKYEGGKIESGKLMFTFYKLLFSFFFFWLLDSLNVKIDEKMASLDGSFMMYFFRGCKEGISVVTYSVFTLLALREWLSIGENIEKRFNKKLYLFSIVEKIFDIIEKKLLRWLDNSDVCKPKNEDNSSEV
jgi:hypothetical protein